MSESVPMTRTGYEKLVAEIQHLETVEMPEIEARIAHARAEGDLKENAEYHGARESQGLLQAKINMLKDKLARGTIVDPNNVPKDEVAFGAKVTVKDLDLDLEEEFILVGAGEEDLDEGKINVTSPLGRGFVGKKIGEVAEVEVPAGTTRFEILSISYDYE